MGNLAAPDVYTLGEVRYMTWEYKNLRQLQKINLYLFIRIEGILGKG